MLIPDNDLLDKGDIWNQPSRVSDPDHTVAVHALLHQHSGKKKRLSIIHFAQLSAS